MPDRIHFLCLLIGIGFSVTLPLVVFLHRRLDFASWARNASIIACLAGLGWRFLGFTLAHATVADED
jgi:hypothetical protein